MEKANNNLDVMQTEACAPSATTMAAECEVTDATITSEAVNKEKRIVYVDKEDAWLVDFNVEEFKKDMRKLGDELAKSQKGININDEVNHMNMLVGWSSMASMFALFTLGFGINPFTICCLAIASTSRWTIVAHHTSHGGFDDVDSTGKHNRFQFGLGQLQRFSDWIDWMITEAWNIEHNQLHHYRLNEPGGDPDLVEKNALMVRTMNAPEPVKWVIAFFLAATWKFFYYSPNTFKELKGSQYRKHLQSNHLPDDEETESFLENQFTLAGLFYDAPKWLIKAELVFKVLAPYMLFFFGILPLPFYLLCGYDYYISALGNLILGELLGNVYSFAIVVTNHAGPDMYVYKKRCAPLSGEFYLRQVLSSADFNCGYDVVDFFHGYLNYQVEHHCFPSLSPLCYKIAHPQVKELCKKHNVPFVQENIFIRIYKTVGIITGKMSSRQFPPELENFPQDVKVIVRA